MKKQSPRNLTTTSLYILTLMAIIASSVLIIEPARASAAPGATPPGGQLRNFGSTEEAGTPLQNALKRSIQEQKKLGLSAPASVTYEYDVVAVPKQNKAASKAVDQVTITGRTVLTFEGPEQAGYKMWPDWIVDEALPAGATGSVATGNYNQSVREAVEQVFPGYWKKHKFGYEPRTYVLDETYEVFPQDNVQAEALAAVVDSQSSIAAEVLLGFTIPGPRINYIFNPKVCIWVFGNCVVKLAEAKAGVALDWAFGLRQPARVTLTTPDALEAGTTYMFSSSFTTLDWKEADYARFGVHPGRGKEFAWYFDYFLGVKVIVGGNPVVNWAVESNFDYSKDCSVPVGNGACAIPLQTKEVLTPEQTGLQWKILGIATIGIGLVQEPAISSKRVSADWEVRQGDYVSSSGQLIYSGLGTETSFGPVEARSDDQTEMQIRLTGFRYEFNNFVLSYSGSFHAQFLNFPPPEPAIFHIYTFDLFTLSGGSLPSIGIHAGTEGVVNRTVPVTPGKPSHPITTIALAGTPGNNNWYRSDVQVMLTVTPGSGSGMATYYGFDNTTWTLYTSPLTLGSEGITTLYYYSSDSKGSEPIHTQLIKIDKTPPAISIGSPLAKDYANTDSLILDWTVSENISGIASQSATFDGSPVVNSQVVDLFFLDLGPHNLTVNVTDEAGNSANASVTFNIVADIHSLITTLQRVYDLGWIDKSGTAKSLDAKLNTAMAAIERGQFNAARNQLEAFLNELDAQKYKAVSQQAYDLLKLDVLYVISNLP